MNSDGYDALADRLAALESELATLRLDLRAAAALLAVVAVRTIRAAGAA